MTNPSNRANQQKPTMSSRVMWLFTIISLLIAGAFVAQLFLYNVLPMKWRVLIAGAAVIAVLVFLLFAINGKYKRAINWFGIILAMGFSFVLAAGNYYVYTLNHTVDQITIADKGSNAIDDEKAKQVVSMSVIVKKDSPLQSIKQLDGVDILAPETVDLDNIAVAKKKLSEAGVTPTIANTDSYISAAEKVLDGSAQAMLLNDSFIMTISEAFPAFVEETRALEDVEVTVEVSEESSQSNEIATDTGETKQAEKTRGFNIFLSGIDTYGRLGNVSRSDVNIVVTVNPHTRKVLLTSVPRDSYVKIGGRGRWKYDKLTHAGNYGISASISTLENLFDTNIDYYVRLNFTSFMKIIDQVGGITVNNPYSFTAFDGSYFPKGRISLTGKKALAFVRERKSLSQGDFGRQSHQQLVIEAVFNKLISPKMLLNFGGIMNSLMSSVQTNLPKNVIMDYVNMQLDNGGKWQFSSVLLKGTGKTGLPSYAMPGWKLWMFQLSKSSVNDAKTRINDLLQ